MHGVTHFLSLAVESILAKQGVRAELLRLFWEAETPYIYWRMPWIGYEYWKPEKPRAGFLPEEVQRGQISRAREYFTALFGMPPLSARCPRLFRQPGQREIWSEAGIRSRKTAPEADSVRPMLMKQAFCTSTAPSTLSPAKESSISANICRSPMLLLRVGCRSSFYALH